MATSRSDQFTDGPFVQAALASRPGFTAADLAWERCMEQAIEAFRTRRVGQTQDLLARGLEIAEQHFDRGDPRLAASLTNQAFVMRQRGQVFQAKRRFKEALQAWDETWRWILLMTPSGAPRPECADYHHPGLYDQDTRTYFTALVAYGRATTAQLERYDLLPSDGLEQWFEMKPRGLTDLRKLLAAVFLIVSRPV